MTRIKQVSLSKKNTTFLISLLFTCLCGCTVTPQTSGGDTAQRASAESLFTVDCLLPPQVRQLGKQATYMTARRPVKASAADCEIRGGEYVVYDRANFKTALSVWLEQAKAGDPEAQTYVGEIYEKGLGLSPDYQLARQWYNKAATAGNSRAQINLGNIYEQGLGVPVDKVAALNWYRKASGFGDDIEYVSTINAKVDIRAEQIANQRAAQYQREIAAQKSAITALQTSLAATRLELESRSSDLEASNQELDQLKRSLEEKASQGIDDAALNRALEAQRQRVVQAQREVETLRQTLSQQMGALSAPVIEITSPTLLATRGNESELTLRFRGNRSMLQGRIIAPAGLKSAFINGRALLTNSDGVFQTRMPTNNQPARMTIIATDRRGETGQLTFTVLPATDSAEQQRSLAVTRAAKNINFGRYYALIIGNNEYQDYQDLQTPINDANAIAKVLKTKYGFNTTVVENANRYDLVTAISRIKNQVTDKDNLLIYYAGHGEIDQETQQGFWLPTDAERNNTAQWIANNRISELINTIRAKHILVIADSCYSGSMSQSAIPRLQSNLNDKNIDKWLQVMNKTRSRTVLTSGGVEPVLDGVDGEHSVFARALLNELEQNDGVIDAYRIYLNVYNEVRARAADVGFLQEPSYAPISLTGHSGGEFILVGS